MAKRVVIALSYAAAAQATKTVCIYGCQCIAALNPIVAGTVVGLVIISGITIIYMKGSSSDQELGLGLAISAIVDGESVIMAVSRNVVGRLVWGARTVLMVCILCFFCIY